MQESTPDSLEQPCNAIHAGLYAFVERQIRVR